MAVRRIVGDDDGTTLRDRGDRAPHPHIDGFHLRSSDANATASRRNRLPWKTSGGVSGSAPMEQISSRAMVWSPAATSATGRQSNHALAPWTNTAPPGSSVHDTPAKRSPTLRDRLTQASP